jgi:hypothetical protein
LSNRLVSFGSMVYSLLVITARNWTVKESIQDLKIFFRRDSGFVQQVAEAVESQFNLWSKPNNTLKRLFAII